MLEIKKRNIQKTTRNGSIISNSYFSSSSTNNNSGSGSGGIGKDPRIDKWFYEDETGNLHTYLSFVGDKEISSYGVGESSGSTGSVTIIDNLTSTAKDAALSANMGRELKSLIDSIEIGGGEVDLSNYYTKTETDNKLNTKANTTDLTTHTSNKDIHITTTERTNWNTAFTNNHTHSNKSILDGITSANITNWNNKLDKSVWDKAFYFDEDNNLKVKLNLIGEKEVSAYGVGSTSGGGVVTIVDNLNSTATDAALSANQGRILNEKINNIEIPEVDLTNYYTKTETDSKYVTALGTSGNYLTYTKNGTTNNITVPFATNANNANTLNSKSLHLSGQNPYGKIPFVASDGVMEFGKIIDFHTSSTDSRDYAVRLQATNNEGSYTVNLPSSGGTLALKTDTVSNSDKLDNHHETEFFRKNRISTSTDKNTLLYTLCGTAIDSSNPNYKGMYVGFATTSSNSNILLHLEEGSNPRLLYNYVIDSNRLGGDWKEFVFNTTPGNILRKYEIDTVGLDEETYYPVTIPIGATYNVHIEINVSLDGKSKPSWSTHNSGFSVRKVWIANGGAYGQNKINRRVLISDYLWAKEDPVRGIGQLYNSSNEYVYVRGGAKYQFYISNNFAPTLHKEKYTVVNQSIEPIKRLTDTGEISSKLPAIIEPHIYYSEWTAFKFSNNGSLYCSSSVNINNAGTSSETWRGYQCGGNTVMRWNGSTYNNLILSATGGAMYFRPNGTSSTEGELQLDKSGNLISKGEVTAYSDKRLKSNIKELYNRGYITPVTYIKNGKENIGFIAQEVKEKYPELVIEDNSEEKYLSLNYAQYTAVLQAQIIELNNTINSLQDRITKLENNNIKNIK